jgi:hypothetical protein
MRVRATSLPGSEFGDEPVRDVIECQVCGQLAPRATAIFEAVEGDVAEYCSEACYARRGDAREGVIEPESEDERRSG